eukprot:484416-Pelagomonas_calceolata.AAC.5
MHKAKAVLMDRLVTQPCYGIMCCALCPAFADYQPCMCTAMLRDAVQDSTVQFRTGSGISSNKLSTVSNEHIAAYQEARKQCQKWTTPLSLDMLFPGFLSQIMPTIMYIQSQKGPTKA